MSEEPEVVYSQEQLKEANCALVFCNETPSYYATEKNADALQDYLDQMGWEVTVENLQKAYRTLSTAGMLEVRPKTPEQIKRERLASQQLSAVEEQQQIAAEEEAAELQRRKTMPLSELKKLTRMEISRNQRSPHDGITRTEYPVGKLGTKSKLI